MIGVLLVDAGLALILLGAGCAILPLRRPRRRSRKSAFVGLAAGLGLLVTGALLPAPVRRVSQRRSLLDDFVPDYHFSERHETVVHAPPGRVFAAIRSVTAREIRFFRLLTWIRAPRVKRVSESILAPPADRPILDVALESGFLLLAERSPQEIVIGAVLPGKPAAVSSPEAFRALDLPGFSKAVMNFRVQDLRDGSCRLATETRIFSTDDRARRAFAVYWRVIYPGSSLIRRMWLDAIRHKAEVAAP